MGRRHKLKGPECGRKVGLDGGLPPRCRRIDPGAVSHLARDKGLRARDYNGGGSIFIGSNRVKTSDS